MFALRSALVEWQVVRARLVRTRLGVWLLALVVSALALPGPVDADGTARVGLLAAALCVAFGAGSDGDRAALRITLSHPTTPLAVAAGRALAAMVAADAVVLAVVAGLAWRRGWLDPHLARAAIVGLAAAAAGAGCTLAAAWTGGNALVGALVFHFALLSSLAPDRLLASFEASPLAAAGSAVLWSLPGTWRAGPLAAGEPGAWLHALAWAVGGTVWAAARLRRRIA
ncbi:MAG TPA: hypothetical protein VI139_00430 [Gemmatimonadales bacterium]